MPGMLFRQPILPVSLQGLVKTETVFSIRDMRQPDLSSEAKGRRRRNMKPQCWVKVLFETSQCSDL